MCLYVFIFFFKQKTAYEMRISDWSSDVCSSDLGCDLVDCPAILGRNAQFNCPRKLDLPGAFEFGPSDCDTRCICETWVQPFFIGAGWGRSAEDQFDVGVGLDQLRKDRCVITGFCVRDMMSFVDSANVVFFDLIDASGSCLHEGVNIIGALVEVAVASDAGRQRTFWHPLAESILALCREEFMKIGRATGGGRGG